MFYFYNFLIISTLCALLSVSFMRYIYARARSKPKNHAKIQKIINICKFFRKKISFFFILQHPHIKHFLRIPHNFPSINAGPLRPFCHGEVPRLGTSNGRSRGERCSDHRQASGCLSVFAPHIYVRLSPFTSHTQKQCKSTAFFAFMQYFCTIIDAESQKFTSFFTNNYTFLLHSRGVTPVSFVNTRVNTSRDENPLPDATSSMRISGFSCSRRFASSMRYLFTNW